jgi:hypothetical protein
MTPTMAFASITSDPALLTFHRAPSASKNLSFARLQPQSRVAPTNLTTCQTFSTFR